MNKLLTFFLTALLAFSVGWATEVTDVLTQTWTGVTGTQYSNFVKNAPTSDAIYAGNCAGGNSSIQLRTTNNNSGIVTTGTGGKVKSITVVWNSSTASGRTLQVYGKNSSYSTAANLYNDNLKGTLLGTIVCGTSTSLTISGDYEYIGLRSASSAMYLTSISIVWETGGGSSVDAPTITPNGGTFVGSQQVTLSHDDADAAIYYTLDGSDPTTSSTLYSAPFTISETTTVKAIAVKNGVSSSPATATFTKAITASTIAEAYALAVNTNFTFTGNVVVTYQNGNNLWIRDASGSGLIYGSGVGTFANGNILNSGWTATNAVYNGLPEFSNPSNVSLMDQGSTVDPLPLTTLTTGDVNKYASLSNVYINSASGSDYYTEIGGTTFHLRNQYGLVTLTQGKTYDVVGIVTIYNNEIQFNLISATEVTSGDPTIFLSPTSLTINDSGTNNTFTVEASHLANNDQGNVGVSASSNEFGLTFSSDTNETATWGFLRDNNFAVNGTVAVNYTGRALSATTTVTAATQGDSKSVDVTYVPDLYIVTDYGHNTDNGYSSNGWDFANGTSMANNNGIYTATFTADLPNTYIVFARKLGESDPWNTRSLLGPSSSGNWWLPTDGNGNGSIDVNNSNPIKIQGAGTYIVTIDATGSTVTFTITKQEVPQGDVYEKVTSNDGLVSGDYLIVYENDSKAFDGSLDDLEPVFNVFDVTINNNRIITDKAAYFTIDTSAGTIYSASGKYIGRTANSNGFNQSETEAYTHTMSIDNSGNAIITSSAGPKLQMWSQMNNGVMQYRFRYYTSNQKAIQLYRKQGGSTVVEAPVITPEGGTSNKRFESFNVTITAANGCTIYYTTDGSTPTTSSTQYSEPFVLPYGSAPTTVKAIAVDGQGNLSAVTSMTYYWDRVSVTISPESKQVTGDVNVTITATPSDATVTYTINGGEVLTYDGEFNVPVSEENSPVTVAVTATKGESTATTSATYTLVDASATLYTKVTSESQIQAGLQYILVHEEGPHALNNFTTSGTGGTGVTVDWETPGSVIDIINTDAIQFTMSGDKDGAQFYYGDNIYLGRSGNNGLANNSETVWVLLKDDNNGGYYLAVGTASNAYRLRYNAGMSGADKFRCYSNNTGDGVYLYVQGVSVTELPLDELVASGVQGKKYKITNDLTAARVTWDDEQGKFAIFAKDNNLYANKRAPLEGQEEYLIEYQNQEETFTNEVEQKDYDQSNWLEILIPSNITSKVDGAYQTTLETLKAKYQNKILTGGTISGTYVDALNPTINMKDVLTEGEASPYTPNIYCTGNFLAENLDDEGDEAGAYSYRDDEVGGKYYFFMDPKPLEYCLVVWAYFIGDDDYFVAPAQEGNAINGHKFRGSFLANMALCEDVGVTKERTVAECFDPSNSFGTQQKLYGFEAIVRKNPAAWTSGDSNGAPMRITPYTDGKEATPLYVVYPLNSGDNANNSVTAVEEISTGKTVKSVHYYNIMGQESQQPFEGINIVVTRYSDGSTSTVKVLK